MKNKELAAILLIVGVVGIVGINLLIALIFGIENAFIAITPDQCSEYKSWAELFEIITVITLTTLVICGGGALLTVYGHKIPNPFKGIKAPKWLDKMIEKRNARIERIEYRKENNPNWWDRNEPTVVLVFILFIFIAIYTQIIVSATKSWYCIL